MCASRTLPLCQEDVGGSTMVCIRPCTVADLLEMQNCNLLSVVVMRESLRYTLLMFVQVFARKL